MKLIIDLAIEDSVFLSRLGLPSKLISPKIKTGYFYERVVFSTLSTSS